MLYRLAIFSLVVRLMFSLSLVASEKRVRERGEVGVDEERVRMEVVVPVT